MATNKQINKPLHLSLTKQQMANIFINNHHYAYTLECRDFYDGLVFEMTETGRPENLRLEFRYYDTMFITSTVSGYNKVSDAKYSNKEKLQKIRYCRTYENFKAFYKFKLNELRVSDRHTAEQRLTKEHRKVMIYIAWLLIPKWAKNEKEYNQKWGHLGLDLPSFYNHENYIPELQNIN